MERWDFRRGCCIKPVDRTEGESQSAGSEEEAKKMHHYLRSLLDKYEEMVRRIGALSLVDQLLTSMNLPYSVETMVVPLPQKFKVTAMEMYNSTKDPVEHLENFKDHMTLHRFPGEIAC